MRILFIPNWNVARLASDDATVQAPDKHVEGQPYWFFTHFTSDVQVDVLDIGRDNWLRRFERRLKFYISQPIKAWRRRNGYDLVMSHGAQSGLLYELLSSWSRRRPPHLMVDVGALNGGRETGLATRLIRYAMRRAPHLIVHSRTQLPWLERNYPNLAARACYIPFGVDVDDFVPLDVPHERTIVSFGYAKRDFDTLCQAFASLPDSQGYRLLIIGDTSLSGSYAHCPGIEFKPAQTLPQLRQAIAASAAVALILPDYPYSYGQMSVLQSMAMGKPLIVSDTASTHDYVSDAPGVMLVPVGDVDAVRRALEQMIHCDDSTRRDKGMANRDYVVAHHSQRAMAQRIEQLIKEILEK